MTQVFSCRQKAGDSRIPHKNSSRRISIRKNKHNYVFASLLVFHYIVHTNAKKMYFNVEASVFDYIVENILGSSRFMSQPKVALGASKVVSKYAKRCILDHIVLTDDVVRAASGLGHPPFVHIL